MSEIVLPRADHSDRKEVLLERATERGKAAWNETVICHRQGKDSDGVSEALNLNCELPLLMILKRWLGLNIPLEN